MAAVLAVAVDAEGRREIVGPRLGPSKAGTETFWAAFLEGPLKRGLEGLGLAASGAHEGLEAAIRRVPGATWRRRRVRWMRSASAHAPEGRQDVVAAALRQAFLRADQDGARQVWRQAADRPRPL